MKKIALVIGVSGALLCGAEVKIVKTIPLAPEKQIIREGKSLEYALPMVKRTDGSWKKQWRVGVRLRAFAVYRDYGGWSMLMQLKVNGRIVDRFNCDRIPRLVNRPDTKKILGGPHKKYQGDPWYVAWTKSWDVCYGPDFTVPPKKFNRNFSEDVTDYFFDIDDLVAADAPVKIGIGNIADRINGLKKLMAAKKREFPLAVKEISVVIFENPADRVPASKKIAPPSPEKSAAAAKRLRRGVRFSPESERAWLRNMKFAEENFRNCERIEKRGFVLPGHVWLMYDSNARKAESYIPQLDLARKAGADLIKVHADWADICETSPFLTKNAAADKDFRRFIELCHERGMKLIVYVSPAWVKFNKAYDKRWEFSDPTARPRAPKTSWGLACTGSPEFRSYFFSSVAKLFDDYPVDGIYVDHGIYDEKERACRNPGHIHPFARSGVFDSSDDMLTKLYALCKSRGKLLYLFAESKPGVENYCDVHYVGESTPSMQAHIERHRKFRSNVFFLPMPHHFTYYSWREVYACTMALGHFPVLSYYWKRVESDGNIWFRHFLPLWKAMCLPGTRIYRDIGKSPFILKKPANFIVTAYANTDVYLVVTNLGYKPAPITFAGDVTDLESGVRGRTFTVAERDCLILRFE